MKPERLSVTIEEIDAQRVLGWVDFHPEDYCHRCGGKNPGWYTDSDRWNVAEGMFEEWVRGGIVCPGCFVELHERATGLRITWKLIPDPLQSFSLFVPWEPVTEKVYSRGGYVAISAAMAEEMSEDAPEPPVIREPLPSLEDTDPAEYAEEKGISIQGATGVLRANGERNRGERGRS